MTDSWRYEHGKTIDAFLEFLNNRTDQYVLKGGTALMKCYGLNRFSEDIDLDGFGRKKDIISLVEEYCKINSLSFRVGKDTDTTKRCFINYGNDGRPLKIEASFRRRDLSDVTTEKINGIMVYSINDLCLQKSSAYSQRDKIRDLFDLSFITNNYYYDLNPFVRSSLRSAIEYKGLEQFDYIVREQADELVDIDVLAENVLMMFDKLGILSEKNDKAAVEEHLEQDILCSDVPGLIDDANYRAAKVDSINKNTKNEELDK